MEHHATPHHTYSDVKTLISWSAPGRPFRKKGREFYLSSLMVVFFIEVILFIFSEYLLMFVVGTLYFFALSLAMVPPQNYHYRISTQGIKIEDHFYIWEELYDFYFKRIDGTQVLIIDTKDFFPGELKLSLADVPVDHVRRVLLAYLPYREVVKPTFIEKSGDWLSKNFPLER